MGEHSRGWAGQIPAMVATYRERRDIAEGPLRQALPVTRHVRDQLRPPRIQALPARYRRRNHFPVNMPIAAGEVLFLHSA